MCHCSHVLYTLQSITEIDILKDEVMKINMNRISHLLCLCPRGLSHSSSWVDSSTPNTTSQVQSRVLTVAGQGSRLSSSRDLGQPTSNTPRILRDNPDISGKMTGNHIYSRCYFPVHMSIQETKLIRSCLVSIELEQMELWSVEIFHQTEITDWMALLLPEDILFWRTSAGLQINTDIFYY